MKIEVLPLGSIVKVASMRYTITGYTFAESDEKFRLHYILISYPFEYKNETSFKKIMAKEITEVLNRGYDLQGTKIIALNYELIDKIIEKCSKEQMNEILNSV